MSISQLLQPNPYTVYGNLSPTQSGNILFGANLIFATPGGTPPVYDDNRTFYNVVGNCVTFQSYASVTTKGNGTGALSWQLPSIIPQGFDSTTEPSQMVELTIFGLVDKDEFLDVYCFMGTDNKFSLNGRRSADGEVVAITDADVINGFILVIRGSYFTL